MSCTGTTTNYDAGTQTNLNITVQSGATVIGVAPTDAIRVQNSSGVTGNALINNGTINGFVTILSVNPGTDTFTNNGVLEVTDPNSVLQQHSMAGTLFTQSASGIFYARVDQNGFNDGILARTATLNGGFVAVIQPGLYPAAIDYPGMITTTAGITGGFATVTASSPFFTVTLTPAGNNLDLTITPIAFNAVPGLTPNQKAVATALQNAYAAGTPTGNAATLFSNLFAATSVNVFDPLSGAGTSAAQGASFAAGNLFNLTMLQQGMLRLNGGGTGTTFGGISQYADSPRAQSKPGYEAFASLRPAPEPGRWRAWGLGFGGYRSTEGQASLGTVDQSQRTYGGAVGVDHQISGDVLVGFAAGGSGSTFSTPALSTSGRIDGGHAGVYMIKTFGPAYLAATLNYARFDNSTSRTIAGVGPTENASGHFTSHQLGGRVELGHKFEFGRYAVTPFAAVEPSALWQHAYSETSTTLGGAPGILGLSYGANTVTSLPTFLGAQVDTHYVLGEHELTPFARAAWVHEFEPKRQVNASFVSVPGTGFTVDGARPSADAARFAGGGTLTLTRALSVFANLESEYSDRGRSHTGTGGIKVVW